VFMRAAIEQAGAERGLLITPRGDDDDVGRAEATTVLAEFPRKIKISPKSGQSFQGAPHRANTLAMSHMTKLL
jgi:hypothetical protein